MLGFPCLTVIEAPLGIVGFRRSLGAVAGEVEYECIDIFGLGHERADAFRGGPWCQGDEVLLNVGEVVSPHNVGANVLRGLVGARAAIGKAGNIEETLDLVIAILVC